MAYRWCIHTVSWALLLDRLAPIRELWHFLVVPFGRRVVGCLAREKEPWSRLSTFMGNSYHPVTIWKCIQAHWKILTAVDRSSFHWKPLSKETILEKVTCSSIEKKKKNEPKGRSHLSNWTNGRAPTKFMANPLFYKNGYMETFPTEEDSLEKFVSPKLLPIHHTIVFCIVRACKNFVGRFSRNIPSLVKSWTHLSINSIFDI